MDTRWENGIWLGVRDESGEIIIGTNKGVIKARTFKRYGRDEDRWCWEKFDAFRGVPWEPVPGRGGIEVHTRVTMPRGEEEIGEPQKGTDKKITMRRILNFQTVCVCINTIMV